MKRDVTDVGTGGREWVRGGGGDGVGGGEGHCSTSTCTGPELCNVYLGAKIRRSWFDFAFQGTTFEKKLNELSGAANRKQLDVLVHRYQHGFSCPKS